MSNSTPGPWTCERQDEESGEIYWAVHAKKNYQWITNVWDSESNARLIAAAPELLAVVVQFVAACDTAPPTSLMHEIAALVPVARAAISKATECK